MSFILDALKKSETERQRHDGPSMAEIPYGRPRATQPLWMMLIVGLLLINLGVLTFWLWRKDSTPAGVATSQTSAPTQPQAAAKPAPAALPPAPIRANPSSSPVEVRPLSGETYLNPEADASAQAQPEPDVAEPGTADGPKLVRRATTAMAPLTHEQADASASGVATLDALGGAGALNLPQLHLDIHVYSAKPAERFVFINMHKYTEGQAMSEGPTVERITGDGVILTYRNQRFLMPRQ